MNIWIISDTHFGHELMLTLGVRSKDYEKEILNSMVKLVKKEDLLIHLGDLAFKPNTEIGQALSLVKGNKILVRGNHDGGFEKYFKLGFNMVCDEFKLDFGGRYITFSHEPVKEFGVGINIHGHLHGDAHRLQNSLEWYNERPVNTYIDMAPEVWGNRVVSLNEVLKKLMVSH